MTLSVTRNSDLDALRAIAVMMVFVEHQFHLMPGEGEGLAGHLGLWTGVDLFFALSGYLIYHSLAQRMRRMPSRLEAFRDFWRSRCRRLLLQALLWLAFGSLIHLLFIGEENLIAIGATTLSVLSASTNIFYSACTNTLTALSCPTADIHAHYWSLALELQFYLVASVMALLGSRFLAIVALGGAAIVSSMLSFDGVWSSGWVLRPYGFIFGIALAWLEAHHGRAFEMRSDRMTRWFLLTACVSALGILGVLTGPVLVFTIGFISAIAVWLAVPGGCFSSGLVGRGLAWIGRRSYAFYLCHYPILQLIAVLSIETGEPSAMRAAVWWVVGLAASLLAAHVSYCVLENRKPVTTIRRPWALN